MSEGARYVFVEEVVLQHDFHYVTGVKKFGDNTAMPDGIELIYMCKKCGRVKHIVIGRK